MARRVDRRIGLAFAALVLALGYEFYPRDERKILALLDSLSETANRAHDPAGVAALDAALAQASAPNLSVRVREIDDGAHGLDDLDGWSSKLLTLPPLTFSFTDAEARVEGNVARVQANLLISEHGSSEQHRDLRPTQINLHRSDGKWLIESITVDPVSAERPEARP